MSTRYLLSISILSSLLLVTACGGGSSSSPGPALEVGSHPLNDTGITLCGDYAIDDSDIHQNDLVCADVGATQTTAGTDVDGDPVPAGQDAVFGRDAQAVAGTLAKIGAGDAGFDFTKLDSNGDELPASATEWDCVRDNNTGLIWEVKTDDGGLRDQNHTYSWYNTDADNNGGNPGTADDGTCFGGTGCDIEKFVDDVNTAGLCGADDWRMPQSRELVNIMHLGRVSPTIDSDYFPHTPNEWFWSITPEAGNNLGAFHVNFSWGGVSRKNKAEAHHARLVRGSLPGSGSNTVSCDDAENTNIAATTPTDDFIDHGDATVTHETTGLMWMQCPLGLSGADCTTGTATTHNWKTALEAAQAANAGGYDDWRLPNTNELKSIIERRCSSPYINASVFPATPSGWFWSSSPSADTSDYARRLNFHGGSFGSGLKNANTFNVRLVRAGD